MKLPNNSEHAYTQAMALIKRALAMRSAATPEWLEFIELVKAMRDAQRTAEFGVAYSKIKRAKAERPVDELLREFEEAGKPVTLDFIRYVPGDEGPMGDQEGSGK